MRLLATAIGWADVGAPFAVIAPGPYWRLGSNQAACSRHRENESSATATSAADDAAIVLFVRAVNNLEALEALHFMPRVEFAVSFSRARRQPSPMLTASTRQEPGGGPPERACSLRTCSSAERPIETIDS